ncbi:PAS domain-containing protein [Staphylococcus arlettae]|nr:PAS domain-containing protein [Staphylococcus arlettae]
MNKSELEALVEVLLNISHQSYTIIDKEGRVVYWSMEASNIFQISNEDIIGKSINQFFEKKDLIILESLKKRSPTKKKNITLVIINTLISFQNQSFATMK